MTFVKGVDPDLTVYINKKSLNIDLLRTNNIRIRIKTSNLYNAIDRISSFKISMYEIINGERQFVSSQTLTVFKGTKKSRVISIAAGYFASPTKQVEFDVYDTEGNLINTYSTELSATNLDSQVAGGDGVNLHSAECDYTNFDDCQLDYLFNRITFEAKPQKQISTRIVKSEEGLYKVTIPVPRSEFKFLGRSVNRGKKDTMNTGNGTVTLGFGETIAISNIQIGPDTQNFGTISYDPVDNQFTFGPTNSNTPVVIGADGKVGIGVDPANGFLDVRGGDGTTPSVIIEPGILAGAPPNGALEFDGNNIYFTKNGVRGVLGAQGLTGPTGPAGPQGATGPAGPAGSGGTASLATNSRVNGDLIFVNGALLENATLNGSVTMKPGSIFTLNGVTLQGPHITFNGTVFADMFNGGTFKGSSFIGGVFNGTHIGNGAGLTNLRVANIPGVAAANGTVNNLTINNGNFIASTMQDPTLNGAVTINGTVFSDRFNATLFNGTTFNGVTANFTTINATSFIGGSFSGTGADLTGVQSVNASLLANLNPNQFLRSDVADTYNGPELDFSAASKLDLNGDLEIADTNIIFDGVSTMFNGSGAFSIRPAPNTNVNIDTTGGGDFTVKNNVIFAEGTSGNVGIGTANTVEKLTVNGFLALLETGSIPPDSAGFGKLYVKTADAKLYFHSSDGNDYDLTAAATGGGDAGTLDGIDSTEFLRANASTTYSVGTFTVNPAAIFDINSSNISFRDNSIDFDTATNTTLNGSGAFTIRPMAGSNLNVNLANTGDFKINTNDLVVDTSAGFIGLGTVSPQQPLHINAAGLGSSNASVLMTSKDSSNWIYGVDNGDSAKFKLANGNDLTTSVVFTALKSGNIGIGYINPQAKLNVNGQVLATVFNGNFIGNGKLLSGVIVPPAGTNTQIQFNDAGVSGADSDLTWNKTTNTLTVTNQIISSSAKFTTGAAANYLLKSDAAGNGSWVNPNTLSVNDANLLDGIDSSAFLRSNVSDTFNGAELDFVASSTLDINGDLEIADTNIIFDGASTTFNGSGAFSLRPAVDANVNINISANGDFVVKNNLIFVEGSNGNVGIGIVRPQSKLHVNGQILATTFNGTFIGSGAGLSGVLASPGGSSTQLQFNNGGFMSGTSNLIWNKDTATLKLAAGAGLHVNGDLVLGDTNISLSAASTKFTQSTGSIQMIPGAGTTFTVNGALTLVPSAVALISAGSSIPVANSIVKLVGNGGPVNISFNPQLEDGVHGQIIILRGASNVNTVTLEEGNGLALTDGLSFILGNKDTMSLMYDAADDQWIEISRSDK